MHVGQGRHPCFHFRAAPKIKQGQLSGFRLFALVCRSAERALIYEQQLIAVGTHAVKAADFDHRFQHAFVDARRASYEVVKVSEGAVCIPFSNDIAPVSYTHLLPAPDEIETGSIVGGFAHNQVIALADKVVEAVKSGAIKKFFVMAGCDGRMKPRAYYTEFAESLPKDTVILTAGCAKYRYNKLKLGDIGGIPRVLDAGQCNDSYSLAVIALKLKEVFGLDDINKLPIAFNIAWYEQKAVIVLLALLYLGVKNIHLGPTLPGFLSPNVANVLVEKFGIAGIGAVDADIELFMAQ